MAPKRDISHLTSSLRKLAGKLEWRQSRGDGFEIETARARYKIPRFRYAGLGWVGWAKGLGGLGLWCAIGI